MGTSGGSELLVAPSGGQYLSPQLVAAVTVSTVELEQQGGLSSLTKEQKKNLVVEIIILIECISF